MEIHRLRHKKVVERFASIRESVRAGHLVLQTAQQMTGYTPADVESAVRAMKVVLLKVADKENAYVAFYSPTRDAVFVAVVSVDPDTFEDGRPVIAEIISVQDYEALGGEISQQDLRRAAALVLDPVALRGWESRHLGEGFVRPQPRVIVHYVGPDGSTKHRFLKRAPVCQEYIDTYGLENALGHPGVLAWFGSHLERAGIDPVQVVSLEIVDAVKMRLRVGTENHPCPDCALTPADDRSEAGERGGAIGRFFNGLLARLT